MLAKHIARSKAYDEGLVLPKTEVISRLLIEHIFRSRGVLVCQGLVSGSSPREIEWV